MKTIKLLLSTVLAAGILLTTSCGNDDDGGPKKLNIVSIEAAGTDVLSGQATTVDLNGATAATGVPIDVTVKVTFDGEVDSESVGTGSISLTDGTTSPSLSVSISGEVLTITSADGLLKGTEYTISFSGIESTKGASLESASRGFKTGGVAPVTPPNEASQVAYWSMDGDTDDQMGNYTTGIETDITFTEDRHGQAASTASFNGTTSIAEINGADELLDTDDFTLSFWIKSNSSLKTDGEEPVTKGQFVLGLGAWYGFQFEISGGYGNCKLAGNYTVDDGEEITVAGQDLWWSTNGDLGWQGWTFDKDVSQAGGLEAIAADKWMHVICTYDATTQEGSMYINGELVKQQDFELYGEEHTLYNAVGMGYRGNDTPGNRLALGFIQGSESRIVTDEWADPSVTTNNHFHGEMDDVRIFHAAFSADDASDLYDAEKP